MAYETDGGVVCEQCGNEYTRIGSHWVQSDVCSYPPLSDHQKEVAIGLLMGDGSLNRVDKNPYLQSNMISPNYLEYVDDAFGPFGTGVSLSLTAEESAKENRESGFSPNADAENYSDMYHWQSRNHPQFHQFAPWYDSGEKVWPDDIELTPTVLKHWYCGDGCWNNSGASNHIRITMANGIDNTDKVEQYFTRVGLSKPSNWIINELKTGHMQCTAQFTVKQSKELWEYMGEPLPDFEYKWPEEYHSG